MSYDPFDLYKARFQIVKRSYGSLPWIAVPVGEEGAPMAVPFYTSTELVPCPGSPSLPADRPWAKCFKTRHALLAAMRTTWEITNG
jgi:hypothetical protein